MLEQHEIGRPLVLNDYVITLDVDWAPDHVIGMCADMLIEAGVKATWLVTHDSPKIRGLRSVPELFEIGIHPNFLAGSTQGSDPDETLRCLLEVVPGARSVRTHCLVQSTPLLGLMGEKYDIKYDLSLLLPGAGGISPHELHLEACSLVRFPTFWADDVEMMAPRQSFSIDDPQYHVAGLKVFCFHPIHIALNSTRTREYRELKRSNKLTDLEPNDLSPFVNRAGSGAGTFFQELLEFLGRNAQSPGITVAELGEKWRP